jgi:Zn-dependent oligopeptidase
MGDHSVDKEKNKALNKRDSFRSNRDYYEKVKAFYKANNNKVKERLKIWIDFFELYQSSPEALVLKNKIDNLESEILKKRSSINEGYIDPYTGKFIGASSLKMRTMISTNQDEKIRKACFDAREKLAQISIKEYIEMVQLRNEYARVLGYSDFYDFKVQSEDKITKKELFSLFDSIYQKTKYYFSDIRKLEKSMIGLRKPWNFSYMMSGDFTKEEDQYFQFDESLLRWGKSFAALGIDYKKGFLKLDLLDRKGKYNNGFCHWTDLVHFAKGKRIAGKSNFTCNVVNGQVGSGIQGYNTLFHEGGHAAHLLNAEQKEVILNQEYFPMSTPWAETQSMFLDTMFSSIDWKTRYAKNKEGDSYPFELFERKVKKLNILQPSRMNSILFVSQFEREIYEVKKLTPSKVLSIARKNYKKYFDASVNSLSALNIPHIYSWESSCSYHGYGLAELAVCQWRDYFYKKYGYIVDNPKVGLEMKKVWKLGARKNFKEFVIMATNKKLSVSPFLKEVTLSEKEVIKIAKEEIKRMESVKEYNKPIYLNVTISMVHGKKEIENNKKSFEEMALKYKKWIYNNKQTNE